MARVFVSYDLQDREFVRGLVRDLGADGVEVVPDPYANPTEHVVRQELSRCQWLLLVSSPNAARSERVQTEVRAAMQYTAEQRMQGVLAIAPAPTEQPVPPAWSVIRSFTSGDKQSNEYKSALRSVRHVVGAEEALPVEGTVKPVEVTVKPAARVEPVREENGRASRLPQRNTQVAGRAAVQRNAGGRGAFLARILPIIVVVVLIILLLSLTIIAIQLIRSDNGAQTIYIPPSSATTPSATSPTTPLPTIAASPQAIYNQLPQLAPVKGIDLAKGGKWEENSSCVFQDDKSYHITSKAGVYQPCMLQDSTYTNFAYQVDMKIVQGDAAGLIFRADSTVSTFYRFSLLNNGNVSLFACTPCNKQYSTGEGKSIPLAATSVQYQPTNTLTVIASDASLALFMNGTFIGQANDTQVKGGGLGLYAASTSTAPAEVAFSHIKVWVL